MKKDVPAPSKPVRKQGSKPAGAVAPKPRQRAAPAPKLSTGLAVADESALLADLRSLIGSALQRIAAAAFATQTMLCWHLGRRLLSENLQGARAEYGQQILVAVSRDLAAEYGRGFSYTELTRMVRFAQDFPHEEIVVTLSRQLSCSHFHALLRQCLHRAREHASEQAQRRLPCAESRA